MSADSFTFLHAADLHLDSPLRGLSAYEGAPADRLRLATREAFAALVEDAIERGVAFVVLSGDVFDGDWPDYDSGLWFVARMRQLERAGIRVFVVSGNHDAESHVTKSLRWPDNVDVFPADRAESFELEEYGVVLHGQSYAIPHVTTNLMLDYPAPTPGRLNIGVLHTALEGREGHGTYAPCTAGDLRSKGYDYWALGHVHEREIVSEEPWIVFPGNLQGRHVRETGAKSATLVHVEDGRIARLEELVHDVARWAHVRVDATGLEDELVLLRRLEEALAEAYARAEGRLLAARVTIAGRTALDGALRLGEHRIRNEVRARGIGVSQDLWIEKVRLETSLLREGRDEGEEFAGLARQLAEAELSEEELAALARDLIRFAAKLPAAVQNEFDPSDPARLASVLGPARSYLAALLTESESTPASTDEDDA